MIMSVKIYGERNTGTTFVRSLIKSNFEVGMLGGSLADEATVEGRKNALALLEGYDWAIRTAVMERLNSAANVAALPATLGWKHMSPPIELLKAMGEKAKQIFFVAVVKHPVFWTSSFFRHPYHSMIRSEGLSFEEFIRKIYVPSGRDNVDAAVYRSVVDLYAAKVDGYRRLSELGLPFELVRYEDLLQDVTAFLARIGDKFGLPRRRDGDVIKKKGAKGGSAGLADFQRRYRLEMVREVVSPEDYTFIMEKFGAARLAWLGYEEVPARTA